MRAFSYLRRSASVFRRTTRGDTNGGSGDEVASCGRLSDSSGPKRCPSDTDDFETSRSGSICCSGAGKNLRRNHCQKLPILPIGLLLLLLYHLSYSSIKFRDSLVERRFVSHLHCRLMSRRDIIASRL